MTQYRGVWGKGAWPKYRNENQNKSTKIYKILKTGNPRVL